MVVVASALLSASDRIILLIPGRPRARYARRIGALQRRVDGGRVNVDRVGLGALRRGRYDRFGREGRRQRVRIGCWVGVMRGRRRQGRRRDNGGGSRRLAAGARGRLDGCWALLWLKDGIVAETFTLRLFAVVAGRVRLVALCHTVREHKRARWPRRVVVVWKVRSWVCAVCGVLGRGSLSWQLKLLLQGNLSLGVACSLSRSSIRNPLPQANGSLASTKPWKQPLFTATKNKKTPILHLNQTINLIETHATWVLRKGNQRPQRVK